MFILMKEYVLDGFLALEKWKSLFRSRLSSMLDYGSVSSLTKTGRSSFSMVFTSMLLSTTWRA